MITGKKKTNEVVNSRSYGDEVIFDVDHRFLVVGLHLNLWYKKVEGLNTGKKYSCQGTYKDQNDQRERSIIRSGKKNSYEYIC